MYITNTSMTVQQIIDELQKIPDKSMPVLIETEDARDNFSVTSIQERKYFVEVCTCFEVFKR